ncbi:hypothetical protein MTO96_039363 [Rhipicephalus appendiculatus]
MGHGAISIAHNTHYNIDDSKFQRCLKDSLAKFNNYAEKNISAEEVGAFAKTLHARYPADVITERFSGTNLSALYQKWDPRAALNIIPIGLRYLTEVDVNGTVQIDILFESLGSRKNDTSDAGAAYILASSVYNALVELAWPSVQSKSNRHAFCTRQIDLLPTRLRRRVLGRVRHAGQEAPSNSRHQRRYRDHQGGLRLQLALRLYRRRAVAVLVRQHVASGTWRNGSSRHRGGKA